MRDAKIKEENVKQESIKQENIKVEKGKENSVTADSIKKNKKRFIMAVLIMLITAGVLLAINYCAVTYCMENLNLFTFMVLVVPIICVAIAAFSIGLLIKWNWKLGACVALILTLISFGAGQMTIRMAGDSLSSIGAGEIVKNTESNKDSELINELYDELDRQAYEYMVEQGLISEGEEIYGGEGNVGKAAIEDENGGKTGEIVSSEMYVGIQKADPVTELIGNAVTFLIAFGAGFVGSKKKKIRC